MKKWIAFVLCIAALCLLLTGCSLFEDDYLSVSEHDDLYAEKVTTAETTQTEEEPLRTASTFFAMKSILRTFITSGIEHGQFKLEGYEGVVGRDLDRVTEFFMTEDPVGAYAIDYMTYEKQRVDNYWLVKIDAVYRRSISEIESIQSTRGNERADELILEALSDFDTSITLQISGYEDEDFLATIDRFAMTRPDVVTDTPQTSVAIYPENGNVRIVELHFSYPFAKDDMRTRTSEVSSILNSACSYAHYGEDDNTKLSLIYSFLIGRFDYVPVDGSSVYGVLCKGEADSVSFAAVFGYLCRKNGIDCLTVQGTHGDVPYYWNIVKLDGVYYHLDMLSCALSAAQDAALLLDADMHGYTWDTQAYPVCNGIPVEEE